MDKAKYLWNLKKTMDSILKQYGSFLSRDGTRIYYESRGEGKPLIFCYGIGCVFNHWFRQTTYFSTHRRTIIFDYRGHHQTPIPENKESLTVESLSEDLIELCEFLKIKKADFAGHSFGVEVLMAGYEKKPDLFNSMTFISGFYRNPFESVIKREKLIHWINQVKKLYNHAPHIVSFLWQKGATNPLFIPISALLGGFNLSQTALKDIEIYCQGIASVDFRVFITLFEDMIAFQGESLLKKIQVPTLVICGSRDGLTPIEDQKKMNQLLSKSQLYIIPKGSHCNQLDFPKRVNKAIEGFLRKNG